jgi:arylamine N-acetyltransferase
MSDVAGYLTRLGLDEELPPTLDTLVTIHRRHLEQVPYENLGIMLGRPPSVDPHECLERVARVGRAGYCFHQNGALQTVLAGLGFEVGRRHGHVWTDPAAHDGESLNHLVLVVSGLPTDANPGGEWWADVGLGDAFRDPLPLVAGEHRQDGFTYRLSGVGRDGWDFHHDPAGSFTGMAASTRSTDPETVAAAHAELSSPPDGHFARVLVVQRRRAGAVDTLRGCVLTRSGPDGRSEADLSSYDEWRGALTDAVGVPVDDLDDAELRDLWTRMRTAHEAWDAAGRP